ncbi:hypothetical protein L198_01563 [Cryptococcus wingfieldii CBS 7118]|uniref:Uncharacterized protein n=1 Tax=Cryptococcus wingfieldii CBS 7118 TaxID=1295528 RepID=A0A1E3JZT6_9TREE|nr:hypothetical protein L198_01563 [Cryptococcus wingfieldii CBS 7118]ODO06331.1 hypothetical protein L198_01563 [Cryptococcus wingfieldii CBS 7118]
MRIFQCAVMGSGGVGKSACTVRFINGSYLEWYDPTIEDSYRKQFTVDNQPCLLEILDTAGIDQYLTLNDLFIRESEGFVLVFSITQRDTFEEVIRTRESISRIKLPSETGTKVSMVIVGNKCDLEDERQVSTAEGEKLAESWDCKYFEASARTSSNIAPVFEEIVRVMRRNTRPKQRELRAKRGGKKCVIL